jgi:hypothetical protein
MSQDGGSCFLTIRGATDRDQGVYTCTIANAAGENSCTAHMRMSEGESWHFFYEFFVCDYQIFAVLFR